MTISNSINFIIVFELITSTAFSHVDAQTLNEADLGLIHQHHWPPPYRHPPNQLLPFLGFNHQKSHPSHSIALSNHPTPKRQALCFLQKLTQKDWTQRTITWLNWYQRHSSHRCPNHWNRHRTVYRKKFWSWKIFFLCWKSLRREGASHSRRSQENSQGDKWAPKLEKSHSPLRLPFLCECCLLHYRTRSLCVQGRGC